MKVWHVTIPTTGYITLKVKADTEEEAMEKVAEGELIDEGAGDWESDTSQWDIEEAEDE